MVDAEWSDFGLRRLFNPDSWEFLPIEDQLKRYKTRDLYKSKVFATASKIWGQNNKIRKRVFIAEQLNTDLPGNVRRVTTAPLNPIRRTRYQYDEDRILTDKEKEAIHKEELKAKTADYKKWLKERQNLRNGLEQMGLQESWLRSKPDPSPLELRVLDRMIKERELRHWQKEAYKAKLAQMEAEPVLSETKSTADDSENMIAEKLLVPSPGTVPEKVVFIPRAIDIIVKHLASRKLRLVDLFTQADKNKNWSLTRQEFKNCIKEAGIPISDKLLDELINHLDQNLDEELDYRELLQGIKFLKLEGRKKKNLAQEYVDGGQGIPVQSEEGIHSRATSATSDISSSALSDASFLRPPKVDITERRELTPDDMIEKRKRERLSAKRRARKKGDKIRTGNRAVDAHSRSSTLNEETADGINGFREGRLKEYYEICKLCKERNITLSAKLLEKALLYPGDKTYKRIGSSIRQPSELLSEYFAAPPPPPETPDEFGDPSKVVFDESGEPMMEVKHSFPMAEDVEPEGEIMNLPTGKAVVSSKINTWLTFEEYVNLTSHLGTRYLKLRQKEVKVDPFWPGHLLSKIQLCMDRHEPSTSNSLFHRKQKTKTVYPGDHNLPKWWPISDQGYMLNGDYEGRKCYNIDRR